MWPPCFVTSFTPAVLFSYCCLSLPAFEGIRKKKKAFKAIAVKVVCLLSAVSFSSQYFTLLSTCNFLLINFDATMHCLLLKWDTWVDFYFLSFERCWIWIPCTYMVSERYSIAYIVNCLAQCSCLNPELLQFTGFLDLLLKNNDYLCLEMFLLWSPLTFHTLCTSWLYFTCMIVFLYEVTEILESSAVLVTLYFVWLYAFFHSKAFVWHNQFCHSHQVCFEILEKTIFVIFFSSLAYNTVAESITNF